MSDTDFAGLTEGLCIRFWGKPTVKTAKELRWGSGGSRKFSYENLVWFDHEAGLGGGAIDLVMRECSTDREGALAWLQKEGLIEARHTHSAAPQRQEAENSTNAPSEPEMPSQEPAGDAQEFEVAHWDYANPDGEFQYRVIRYHYRYPDGSLVLDPKTGKAKKTFKQKSRDASGKITFGLNGREPCLYRWQAIERAIEAGKPIFIVEGEKSADALIALGFEATCNSGGAGKNFTDAIVATLKGAHVVVLPDNDPQATKKVKEKDEYGNITEKEVLRFHDDGRPVYPGQDHAEDVACKVRKIAASVKVLPLPGIPLKGDVVEWIEAGGTADQLMALVAACPGFTPRPPAGFGARTMHSLAGKPIEYDWLIKGLVERNGVFILAAEKQAGKSFVVMDMGMKIARGLQYGDRITRKGIVIHIACEDGKGVQMRAEGYRQANGISPDVDVPYIIMDREFSLMSDDVIDKLIAQVKAWEDYYGMPVEMIIIDTLSVATEGLNEIDGAEVGKVLARVNRLKDQTGAAICLVHHMNASGGRVRGHTSIEANVSQVFEIRPLMTTPQNRKEAPQPVLDGEGRHIRQIVLTKNKNGINNLKWKIVLEVVKLGIDRDGDEITTCICARPARHSNSDAPEDNTKLVGDQKLVFDALVAAQADSTITGEGSGGKAVEHTAFVSAVRKRMSFKAPEEEHEARQTELASFLKRTTTALMNAGYMGRDNDKKVVWWTGKSDRPRPPRREPDPPQPPDPIPDDIRSALVDDKVPF